MPESHESHWLAGLLEGEGSFLKSPPSRSNCPAISLQMTDEDVVSRVASIFSVKYQISHRGKARGWKTNYIVVLRGRRAVDWMRELRPLMGSRRQAQIDAALEGYNPIRKVLSVRERESLVRKFLGGIKARVLAAEYGVAREHVYRLARKHRSLVR